MRGVLVVVLLWTLLAGSVSSLAKAKYDEQQLNQAIQENADDARAWFRLGVLQTHDGRILQAMEAFRQVIRIKPDAVEPHHNLAAIYESLDDFDAAAEELKQVIELAPRDVQSQLELAGIYIKQADRLYRGVARRDPNNKVLKRNHLAQLLCRQSLARVEGSDAMDRVLRRLVQPSPSVEGVVGGAAVPAKDLVQIEHAESSHPKAKREQAGHAGVANKPVVAQKRVVTKKGTVSVVRPPEAVVKAKHPSKHVKKHAKARRHVAKKKRHHRVAGSREQALMTAVDGWHQAWESRNARRYFSWYSKDFVPPKWGLKLWHAHKRNVFRKSKFVRVSMKNVRVKLLGDSHAEVSFDQNYQSDYYQARSRKVMTWVQEKGAWKVLRETSLELH